MKRVPAVDVRDYGSADEAAVLALWRDCRLLHPLNDPARDIEFCRASGHGALFVGEEAGQVVATVMVGHDGHRGWLYYVAVAPDRQRRGLGRRLVDHAEGWLKARGVPKSQLMIRDTNAGVRAFYERLGYVAEPRVVMARRFTDKPS